MRGSCGAHHFRHRILGVVQLYAVLCLHGRSLHGAQATVAIPDFTTATRLEAGPSLTFQPTVEHKVHGRYVVWQKPPQPRGTLFVAHGGSHSAFVWWPESIGCPQCTGLPVEVNITGRALLRGYAVIAMNSKDREGFMSYWPLLPGEQITDDMVQVPKILEYLLKREGLDSLPLYAMGASSGGSFAIHLAAAYPQIQGVCCQITAMPINVLGEMLKGRTGPTHSGAVNGSAPTVTSPYPPTIFVHMVMDPGTAHTVKLNVDFLRQQAVRATAVEVLPGAMTPTYFQEHTTQAAPGLPGFAVDHNMSGIIYETFQKANWLDGSGMLVHDPRVNKTWGDLLKKSNFPGFKRVGQHKLLRRNLAIIIIELLNLLYARHEAVSATTDAMLDFFEAGLSP